MRFEFDRDANVLYVYVRDIPYGGVAQTVEYMEGVFLDVDKEGRTLGVEFVDLDYFWQFLEKHEGYLAIPEHAGDRDPRPADRDRSATTGDRSSRRTIVPR